MPQVLLRPHLHALRGRFRKNRSSAQALGRDLLLALAAVLTMLCVFASTTVTLTYVIQEPLVRQLLARKIVELLCYAFFVLLLFSNTIASIGNIYTSQNMNLLISAPISNLRLFLAKLVESAVETGIMAVVFLLPVGIALCVALDISALFLIVAALLSIPFALIASSLGIIFASAFARIAAVIWKRGLFFLVCLALTLAWLLSNLAEVLARLQFGNSGSAEALVDLLGFFDNPNPIWLPTRWTADLLNYYIMGTVELPFEKILLLGSATIAVISLAFLVFDFCLLPVRTAVSTNEAEPSTAAATRSDLVRRLLETVFHAIPINVQVRAVILKDLTTLFRDRAQALQLLMYLGLSLAYLLLTKFLSAALTLGPVSMQAWWGFLAGVNLLFTGFIIICVMTRVVYPSISLEGKSFWILICSPISLGKFLAAKFWCWLPLAFGVAAVLLSAGVLTIYPDWGLILVSLYIGSCMSIGCTGLAIGIGAAFASFEWESPNQISVGFGTVALLLLGLCLVIVTVIPGSVVVFLVAVPNAQIKLGAMTSALVLTSCSILVLLINVTTARYACMRGARSLQRQFE